jgi:hypothetical protein
MHGNSLKTKELRKTGCMKKSNLIATGMLMLITGLLQLFAPLLLINRPSSDLTLSASLYVFVSIYGGFYIFVSAFVLLAAIRNSLNSFSLMGLVVASSCFAVGRFHSLEVDGVALALCIGLLLFQVFFIVLSLASLTKGYDQ